MITLDHVTKKYKASARPALEDVNVKIDKGEFVFLIGPSGSGKSTFMRLLLGEENPTTGDIRVSKFHVNKLRGRHIPKLRQVIGTVFQEVLEHGADHLAQLRNVAAAQLVDA
ncbi:ATP-binding cassette domain-containing protein, partial [Mycobacterium avium]|uniref:ATP-binding cassette domain-containing protein n=1 Tax=Mycobacterium avium TaxID=1764 RepID=UPI001EEE16F5